MGAAAYTEKYMECHKLERKMKKIQVIKIQFYVPCWHIGFITFFADFNYLYVISFVLMKFISF